jgi:hypothetical protein
MTMIINKHLDVDTYYVPVPRSCRVVNAYSVVDTEAVATAAKTITLSDGTTDIGVITAANSSAEGTMDSIVFDSTSKGVVELNATTPLKIVVAGTGNGEFELVVEFSEFHAD